MRADNNTIKNMINNTHFPHAFFGNNMIGKRPVWEYINKDTLKKAMYPAMLLVTVLRFLPEAFLKMCM